MSYELGLISVVVAGAYWSWFYLRRRPHGGVMFGSLLLLVVLLCLLGLLGLELDNGVLAGVGAIGVGGGVCMLAVAPALRAVARRLAAAERYAPAGRLLDLADLLAPGSGVGEEKALLGAMREIRDGHIEQTVEALTAAKGGAPAEACLAIDERIAMLYLAAYRWKEGIAHAEAHLWPVVSARTGAPTVEASVSTPIALRRILGLAPPVWVELVGAYGRTGDLDRAATMVARLEDACAGRADASVWIHRARLMFLALAGRVAAVEKLTASGHAGHLSGAARTYWRGVAHERHGEPAAATAAYAKARSKSRGKSRELVDLAIARLPTAAPATPSAAASEVIARVEAAPLPRLRGRRLRGPIATWALTGTLVLVSIAIGALIGDAGDPGTLLRAGALERSQIHAGEWWRVVSYMFVHASPAQMVLNAISVWIVGRVCEDLLGTARTLAIFLVAGIAGGVVSYVASPVPVLSGASAGVLGLLGAVFVEITLNRSRYRALWKGGAVSMLAVVLVAEVGFGLLFPAVDQWAHGGGLVAGALLVVLVSPSARWAAAGAYVARALAVAGVALALFAGVQVVRTSVVDSLSRVPEIAWKIGGVTVDAPAAWKTNDGELVDEDVFLVLAFVSYDTSLGLDRDLAAAVAAEPAVASARYLDHIAPATERVVPLPVGWSGSEFEASYENALGDRVIYRVVVAARELHGRVVLASVYAPDSIARDEPEVLSDLLASAR